MIDLGGPSLGDPRHGGTVGTGTVGTVGSGVGTRPAQGTVCPHKKVFWAGLDVPVPGTGLKWSGTGTPSHMTCVPSVPILWAGRACGTVEARPGQSLRAPK